MPQNEASVKAAIAAKIEAALQPSSLEVIDESAQHAGHMLHPDGAAPRGETHFRIKVVSGAFTGQTRLARHRAINDLVEAELKDGVHALAIEARAPGE
jgi:BolA protein